MKTGQTKKWREMCLKRKCNSEPFHASGISCDVPKRVLHHINKEDRDEFLKLANALIHKAVTKNAYEEYRTKLETICICANC